MLNTDPEDAHTPALSHRMGEGDDLPTWNPAVHQYLAESPGTILMLSTPTRVVGLLFSPPPEEVVATSPIFPSTSSPLIKQPKAVYWRSRNLASPRQIKNWLPAESGFWERAMERTPRTC